MTSPNLSMWKLLLSVVWINHNLPISLHRDRLFLLFCYCKYFPCICLLVHRVFSKTDFQKWNGWVIGMCFFNLCRQCWIALQNRYISLHPWFQIASTSSLNVREGWHGSNHHLRKFCNPNAKLTLKAAWENAKLGSRLKINTATQEHFILSHLQFLPKKWAVN